MKSHHQSLTGARFFAASHLEARSSGLPATTSLIVCPQVLVGHWAYEIEKFVGKETLVAIAYEGSPSQRQLLRQALHTVDVIAMSYETLRSDIDWVQSITWNYCILDEGHIIRNPRSKINQVNLTF
jgi:TATA-binding protein-associated factor